LYLAWLVLRTWPVPIQRGVVLAAVKDAARRFAVAFRPSLTAAARGALELSGRDEETAAFSRTRKHNELGSQG